jgi:hypothetical protein
MRFDNDADWGLVVRGYPRFLSIIIDARSWLVFEQSVAKGIGTVRVFVNHQARARDLSSRALKRESPLRVDALRFLTVAASLTAVGELAVTCNDLEFDTL